VHQTSSDGQFDQCSTAVKSTLFRAYRMPIVGSSTPRPVLKASALPVTTSIEFCIAS